MLIPKNGDRIYEQSFSSLEDANIYLIDEVYPMRGRFGEVAYWIAGATQENYN